MARVQATTLPSSHARTCCTASLCSPRVGCRSLARAQREVRAGPSSSSPVSTCSSPRLQHAPATSRVTCWSQQSCGTNKIWNADAHQRVATQRKRKQVRRMQHMKVQSRGKQRNAEHHERQHLSPLLIAGTRHSEGGSTAQCELCCMVCHLLDMHRKTEFACEFANIMWWEHRPGSKPHPHQPAPATACTMQTR